jgi:hypothetical protein
MCVHVCTHVGSLNVHACIPLYTHTHTYMSTHQFLYVFLYIHIHTHFRAHSLTLARCSLYTYIGTHRLHKNIHFPAHSTQLYVGTCSVSGEALIWRCDETPTSRCSPPLVCCASLRGTFTSIAWGPGVCARNRRKRILTRHTLAKARPIHTHVHAVPHSIVHSALGPHASAPTACVNVLCIFLRQCVDADSCLCVSNRGTCISPDDWHAYICLGTAVPTCPIQSWTGARGSACHLEPQQANVKNLYLYTHMHICMCVFHLWSGAHMCGMCTCGRSPRKNTSVSIYTIMLTLVSYAHVCRYCSVGAERGAVGRWRHLGAQLRRHVHSKLSDLGHGAGPQGPSHRAPVLHLPAGGRRVPYTSVPGQPKQQ